MIRALYSAAAGMYAQQLNIDTISNNLANVNTTGFKRSRAEFQDLLYQNLRTNGVANSLGNVAPTELQVGTGVKTTSLTRQMSQGDVAQTDNALDVAIEGMGFYQVQRLDGSVGYTRDGSFKLSSDGILVTTDGLTLQPEIAVPAGTTSIQVSRDGVVSALVGSDPAPVQVGTLELAIFTNPAGLRALGQNLYLETASSGAPLLGTPGTEEFGQLAQGFLESSNVKVVEEMVAMINAQRAYEINSKAIRTSDDMLSTASNLRR
ncbi:MAG: flagellar basal-body rod protein FlgG [Calditrichaeota bacterium]|nr:flagellar basal-body rod protein FlgG [Candidatus Cloacimonadota bacterium]MCB1047330.1 flagellar basal-body rod protein FlgG [Calditrichota bacterium]MCB9474020.1 flagellar basal-body rod protein FlgG [Candidatus Delongbacteria bacterium]